MFTNGLYGVYANIDKLYRGAAASGDANSLGGSINRYSKLLKQVTTDKADLATKQETLRANLVSRLGVSETRITSSKSTLSFLQNQIAAWNNAKG
jgi:flagellar hook-associated protein 2